MVEGKSIEILMDSMNRGIIYIDINGKIQLCNRKAREITGMVVETEIGHDAGTVSDGDIVIISDNMLGEDDGDLNYRDLSILNISDDDIKQGDLLVAIGAYNRKDVQPEYKYCRRNHSVTNLTIEKTFLSHKIKACVDTEKKETLIVTDEVEFPMPYFNGVGNVVILDGNSGKVKFYQAKGYTIRNEDIAGILKGHNFCKKPLDDDNLNVIGRHYSDFFDTPEVSQRLFDALNGEAASKLDMLMSINKRPLMCSIVPWKNQDGQEALGIILIFQDAGNLQRGHGDSPEFFEKIQDREASDERPTDYPKDAFEGFIGKSEKSGEVKYLAYKASKSNFNVIITGESGTGKSRLAREIHNMGDLKGPLVEVNCNAIAPGLFESELFGYVGGAFTGAKKEGKIGLFEAADKGTLFLDEIGEIPPDFQVKLLQVLQNKTIYRVGSTRPISIDVRIIAATNKDLEEEVKLGNFRQDLYYRLDVFPIEIPPIRERKSDLFLLINQILREKCEAYSVDVKRFSAEALQKMISYSWPGNVRELENVIERAVTICDSNIIYSEHLRIGKAETPKSMKELLAKEEARILETTLLKYGGDKAKAMEELDMSRSLFYEKVKLYGIKS